ncbi:MAG: TlpA family protein disulfide reductase [Planctomycetes bacterium]|nr:TlpA family protein disulfide reductase [Planctomycetota bacterium]
MRLFAWMASLGLVMALAHAQKPTVGAQAPAIVASSWLNWQGDAPTLESLQGRVVLLEFWGTWCGPCVRAMPGIQKLHDRYRERGLTVLAISYETPEKMQPFLQANAYTMPVGSDPEKKTIAAYGISGWPTTILLDKEGKVAHVGSPYDAEEAVEKALGLEAGPG